MEIQRLDDVVAFLDGYLDTAAVPDYSGAWNGLQLANRGDVTHVATAVDAAQATIDRAIAAGADLLLVHHGLFWDGGIPLVEHRYRRVRSAIEGGLAIYSSHMPLDVHPEIGNNILLASALDLHVKGRVGDYKGVPVGYWGLLDRERSELALLLREITGEPVRVIGGGPERIRSVGVVTGGASSLVPDAVALGLDAFVTGEAPHPSFFQAEEGGINLYLAGHYATETFGVRELGALVAKRFGVPATFIDHPTGM